MTELGRGIKDIRGDKLGSAWFIRSNGSQAYFTMSESPDGSTWFVHVPVAEVKTDQGLSWVPSEASGEDAGCYLVVLDVWGRHVATDGRQL